jgi:hypothetical protein
MKPGPNDPDKVANYTREQFRFELERAAHNARLTGTPYWAALLERAADEIKL